MTSSIEALQGQHGQESGQEGVLLSICIPTHHGRDWSLKEALDSILPQITGDLLGKVQICVSDNASQDTTQEMVCSYSKNHPGIFCYHRSSESIEPMRNVMQSIAMASGEYCWFLGSDDAFAPNAVGRVLELLREYPGVSGITVNRTNYDKTLQKLVTPDNPLVLPAEPEELHIYRVPEEILLNCSMMQNFLSAQIFQRKFWLEVVNGATHDDLMYFWLYLHSYVLGSISKNHPYWIWCPDRLIKFRTGNEAFWETLTFEQYANNNMQGIKRQWSALLGDKSPEYRQLMADFYRIHWDAGRCHMWKAHPTHTLKDDWILFKEFVNCFGIVPQFWYGALPYLVLPHHFNKLRVTMGLGKARRKILEMRGRLRIRTRIYQWLGRKTPSVNENDAAAIKRN